MSYKNQGDLIKALIENNQQLIASIEELKKHITDELRRVKRKANGLNANFK